LAEQPASAKPSFGRERAQAKSRARVRSHVAAAMKGLQQLLLVGFYKRAPFKVSAHDKTVPDFASPARR